MKPLRFFFYLLFAANAVLLLLSALPWLGMQAPWTQSGEADRLLRQLTPEKIKLVPTTSATGASPGQPLPAPVSTETSLALDTQSSDCIKLRNLSLENTQTLTAQVTQNAGLKIQLSGITPTSYWVNIPPGGGKDGANKRAEALSKLGIEDFIIVRDSGPNLFAISLGLFRNMESAQKLMDQLKKKNVKSARITVRDNTGKSAVAELSGQKDALDALISQFMLDNKDATREACAPHAG